MLVCTYDGWNHAIPPPHPPQDDQIRRSSGAKEVEQGDCRGVELDVEVEMATIMATATGAVTEGQRRVLEGEISP